MLILLPPAAFFQSLNIQYYKIVHAIQQVMHSHILNSSFFFLLAIFTVYCVIITITSKYHFFTSGISGSTFSYSQHPRSITTAGFQVHFPFTLILQYSFAMYTAKWLVYINVSSITGTIFSIVPYRLDNNPRFMAQPMINVLNFDMSLTGPTTGDPTSPATGIRFINLPKELSKVNRKLYRSARRYAIAGIQVIGNEGSSVSFFTCNDTWVTKNAIKKAFHHWQKMNKEVLKANPSIKPTWHDFKVFMNAEHRSSNATDLQATPDFDHHPFLAGEWEYSKFVFPEAATHNASTEATMHIHGQHIDAGGAAANFDPANILSVGLIEAYKESRANVPPDRDWETL